MTGPEHYRHAEQLLDWASDEDFCSDAEQSRHAAAQVHATLALAAAHALMGEATDEGWWKVAAPPGWEATR